MVSWGARWRQQPRKDNTRCVVELQAGVAKLLCYLRHRPKGYGMNDKVQ